VKGLQGALKGVGVGGVRGVSGRGAAGLPCHGGGRRTLAAS
jgi:hypothetical protein